MCQVCKCFFLCRKDVLFGNIPGEFSFFLLMIKMHKLTVCISSVLFVLDFLFRLVILTYSGSLQRSGARRGEEMVGADLGNPDGREGEGPEGQGGSTS